MKNIEFTLEFTQEELTCLLGTLVIAKEEKFSGKALVSAAKKIIKALEQSMKDIV